MLYIFYLNGHMLGFRTPFVQIIKHNATGKY